MSKLQLSYKYFCCRKYEYPERDVPQPTNHPAAATPTAAVIGRGGGSSAAVIGRGGGGSSAGEPTAAPNASSLHVTNLVIDKTPTRSAAHNLNLPVPCHPQQVPDHQTLFIYRNTVHSDGIHSQHLFFTLQSRQKRRQRLSLLFGERTLDCCTIANYQQG